MNKKALERFAPAERNYLRAAVEKRLESLGLTRGEIPQFNEWLIKEGSSLIVNQKRYPDSIFQSFQGLYNEYKKVGYDQLIEELAYTWFNRFMAIRYMEVNGVLPDYVKIIERDPLTRRPEVMDNHSHLEVDHEEIEHLMINNQEEEAYRKLFLASVNKLGELMPFLFERLQDWTELVLPDKMLDPNGLIDRILIEDGLTESLQNGVESIGWMYQYYIADLKSAVMKKKKTSKDELPARTQLFTPKWIVKYLVENSLGQIWVEAEKNTSLVSQWKYYVEPLKQSIEVQRNLDEISYKNNELESITVLDPACGSGHILSYAYDLLFNMYLERGYSKREIPVLILTHNLYGIDIDPRAAQLTYFTLIMKAVETGGRTIWRNPIEPNVLAIQESNGIDLAFLELAFNNDTVALEEVKVLLEEYRDAREYGSLLQPRAVDIELLKETLAKKGGHGQSELFNITNEQTRENQLLKSLIKQHELLIREYDTVITNPPYMGNSTMNTKLSDFAKKNYPSSKSDMYAMFMERSKLFVKNYGFNAAINQHSWMFLATYEKLRINLLKESIIVSMLHLGARAFEDIGGEVVQSVAFVLREKKEPHFKGSYYRLVESANAKSKELDMLKGNVGKVFNLEVEEFTKIPGSPLVYWLDEKVRNTFLKNPLNNYFEGKEGLGTSDNNRFLRYWFEVDYYKIVLENEEDSQSKWFLYQKGGTFKKWYGNNYYIINWASNGKEIRGEKSSNIRNLPFQKSQGITWSAISSSNPAFRYTPKNCLFDSKGPMMFPKNSEIMPFAMLAFLNSDVSSGLLKSLSPTLDFRLGQIHKLPIDEEMLSKKIQSELASNVHEIIEETKNVEKFEEVSLLFNSNYLKSVSHKKLEDTYLEMDKSIKKSFRKIKELESENNRIIYEMYNLDKNNFTEMKDEKELKEIETREFINRFLSFFIGCTLGRYSLDSHALYFAGGGWKQQNYSCYEPVKDGIFSLTEEQILPDDQDIYVRLKKFIAALYGNDSMQENLRFIANSLTDNTKEGTEKVIRNYFLKDFMKYHNKLYLNRPIYWLIDSGKYKGMQSLIYMHRYTPYTLGLAMQNHFVPLLNQWRNLERVTLEELENEGVNSAVKKELTKKLDGYQKRRIELEAFQDKLNQLARQEIPIDLDNGVKVNYQKFNGILKEIKF